MALKIGSFPPKISFFLVALNLEKLNCLLIDRINFVLANLQRKALSKMNAKQNRFSVVDILIRSIFQKFKVIEMNFLRDVSNFQILCEQIEYAKTVKDIELPELIVDLKLAQTKLLDYMSFSTFPEEQLELNIEIWSIPLKLQALLESQYQTIDDAKTSLQIQLKGRISQFHQKFTDFECLYEEICNASATEDVTFYGKKVSAMLVQSKILTETVLSFNREEDYYGWILSSYPRLITIHENLKIYQRLFEILNQSRKKTEKSDTEAKRTEEVSSELKLLIVESEGRHGPQRFAREVLRLIQLP